MVSGKTNELKEFIQYSLSKEISKEKIEKILLESGWPENIIEKLFAKRQLIKHIGETGIIKVKSVSKSFGKQNVLDNVGFTVKDGEIFGIIGLSGSGKTTLLNAMVGFVIPESGDIIFNNPQDKNDYSVFKKQPFVKHLFGFATQTPSFYSKLTVEENIMHFASLYGIDKKAAKAKAASLVNLVGLSDSKDIVAFNLSGGMQKRLDIACALVHNPKILILDEPTADLDPVSRRDMWHLIEEINRKGTTILLASHFVNEMEDLCDRVGILHQRKIVEMGTPQELKSVYSKNYEIFIETESAKYDSIIKAIKSKKMDLKEKRHRLLIYADNPEEALHKVTGVIKKKKEKIIDITINKPTLRELFEHFVKNKA